MRSKQMLWNRSIYSNGGENVTSICTRQSAIERVRSWRASALITGPEYSTVVCTHPHLDTHGPQGVGKTVKKGAVEWSKKDENPYAQRCSGEFAGHNTPYDGSGWSSTARSGKSDDWTKRERRHLTTCQCDVNRRAIARTPGAASTVIKNTQTSHCGAGTGRKSSWRARLRALCVDLTADTPTADYTRILEMGHNITALVSPQLFIVIYRSLGYNNGGECTNWTSTKDHPDFKAWGNFSEFTTGARSGVMSTIAVFVTKRPTYVGLTAEERRRWEKEPMHVWGALLVQLPRGHGKALAIYDCNVSSDDYAASLQHTVEGWAVKLARHVKRRGEGVEMWRNPPEHIPNTSGECYSRTFNWLRSVIFSDPDSLPTFTNGRLAAIRGFRKMAKPGYFLLTMRVVFDRPAQTLYSSTRAIQCVEISGG
ncbi:hypothetical protein B0H13DRAFT_1858749 [Mycena leptocephala]|nr:hypothetical protein B0H13DRAFT_1858749 [Mycena leptocephala]